MSPALQYDRTTAARPTDSNLGPVRARPPATAAEIRRLYRGGVQATILADMFELSVRTVYRYVNDSSSVATVAVGRWVAEFAVDEEREPRRLTPWRRP